MAQATWANNRNCHTLLMLHSLLRAAEVHHTTPTTAPTNPNTLHCSIANRFKITNQFKKIVECLNIRKIGAKNDRLYFVRILFFSRGSDSTRRQPLGEYHERSATRRFTAPTPFAPTIRFERIPKRDDRLKYLTIIVVQIEYCTNFCGILGFDNLRIHYIGKNVGEFSC